MVAPVVLIAENAAEQCSADRTDRGTRARVSAQTSEDGPAARSQRRARKRTLARIVASGTHAHDARPAKHKKKATGNVRKILGFHGIAQK